MRISGLEIERMFRNIRHHRLSIDTSLHVAGEVQTFHGVADPIEQSHLSTPLAAIYLPYLMLT